MQKIILVLIFIFSLSFNTVCLASNDEIRISVEEDVEAIRNRGAIALPEVWIDTDLEQLSINFSSSNAACSVTITDDVGTVVYQNYFVADGITYYFDLSSLNTGYYHLIINKDNTSYRGVFYL